MSYPNDEDQDRRRPFVPRGIPVDDRRPPTPEELAEMRRLARAGADALHARTAPVTQPKLTDAESAALARKRIDDQEKR